MYVCMYVYTVFSIRTELFSVLQSVIFPKLREVREARSHTTYSVCLVT